MASCRRLKSWRHQLHHCLHLTVNKCQLGSILRTEWYARWIISFISSLSKNVVIIRSILNVNYMIQPPSKDFRRIFCYLHRNKLMFLQLSNGRQQKLDSNPCLPFQRGTWYFRSTFQFFDLRDYQGGGWYAAGPLQWPLRMASLPPFPRVIAIYYFLNSLNNKMKSWIRFSNIISCGVVGSTDAPSG